LVKADWLKWFPSYTLMSSPSLLSIAPASLPS
jgi:hypothetical protein